MALTRFDAEEWICDVQGSIAGLHSPSPPPAPDPTQVSQAQSVANKETAIAQARLNNVNENSPLGSLTYTETAGPDGTPKFTRNVSLSPDQQKLYDLETGTEAKLGSLASGQVDRLQGVLDTPFDLNAANAVEGKLYDLGARRLDPRFAQEENALRTRLVNSGATPGSPIYEREMENFRQSKNDAYDQLALQGRQQAVTEALAQRNQPLNEVSALMSGSQVALPQFAPASQTGIAPTDVTGAYGLQVAARNNAFNANNARSNGLMGGLFGLGAAGLGGWASSGFA